MLGHAERLVHKLDTFTDPQRAGAGVHHARLIWWFYADLKAYRREPTHAREMRARFDRIFQRRTGFRHYARSPAARLHANKPELLMVLDRPDIPLHTNGSENDIRCQVTKRHISGGTRSRTWPGLPRRVLGLMKTCGSSGIASGTTSGARLAVPDQPAIPYLRGLVRTRFRPA